MANKVIITWQASHEAVVGITFDEDIDAAQFEKDLNDNKDPRDPNGALAKIEQMTQDYVRRKILRQTDIEILEQDKLIEDEIKKGIIPDPNAPIDPQTGQPLDSAAGMDLGAPVMEPEADGSATEAPELPKGGEI